MHRRIVLSFRPLVLSVNDAFEGKTIVIESACPVFFGMKLIRACSVTRSFGVRPSSLRSARIGSMTLYGFVPGTSDRSAKAGLSENTCLMMIRAEKASPFTANGVENDSASGYQSGVEAN